MKYRNLIFFFFLLLSYNAYCQSVSATPYDFLINNKPVFFKEKIYVHTDKNFYVSGEILWFKMYCVDAASGKPADLSKIAYVELFDSANKPLLQTKTSLRYGLGNGSFYLPLSAPSGNYKLRSYTNWMKNEDANDYFEKQITFINVQKLTVDSSNKNNESYHLQFFPEGGNLINGVNNKLAFKGTNEKGRSFGFAGVLIDNNDTLLSFHSIQNGISNFTFTPIKNHAYTALVHPQTGNSFTQNLPVADDEGFALMVDNTTDSNAVVNVATNNNMAQTVYLIIHKNKKAFLAKEATMQNGKTAFSINVSSLPSGISTITIFNAEKQPVCERLFYKKPTQTFQLSLRADATTFDVRKKINLAMQAGDFATATNDSANLSLSVYRLDSLQTLDDNTIDAYLLLTSDLPGEDKNSFSYLNTKQESTSIINDLLLVNGWRKIKTPDANNVTPPVFSFAPEYNGHIITGKLINNETNQPQQDVVTYLSLPGKSTQFYTAQATVLET